MEEMLLFNQLTDQVYIYTTELPQVYITNRTFRFLQHLKPGDAFFLLISVLCWWQWKNSGAWDAAPWQTFNCPLTMLQSWPLKKCPFYGYYLFRKLGKFGQLYKYNISNHLFSRINNYWDKYLRLGLKTL